MSELAEIKKWLKSIEEEPLEEMAGFFQPDWKIPEDAFVPPVLTSFSYDCIRIVISCVNITL